MDRDHRKGNEALWFGLCRARAALARIDLAITACANTLILAPGHREAKLLMVGGGLGACRCRAWHMLRPHKGKGWDPAGVSPARLR